MTPHTNAADFDRIARHYTTAMATLHTASENREGLLQYTYEMMRKQVASGQNTYLILPNAPNFRPLVEMLQRYQIIRLVHAGASLVGITSAQLSLDLNCFLVEPQLTVIQGEPVTGTLVLWIARSCFSIGLRCLIQIPEHIAVVVRDNLKFFSFVGMVA